MGDPAAAFRLLHVSDLTGDLASPRPVGLQATVTNTSQNTIVTLTFTGDETDPYSLSGTTMPVPGPSLSDGRYQLLTGTYDSVQATTDPLLYRIFGDYNVNGVVNAADYAQFRLAYGSSVGDPNTQYVDYFDDNADGAINALDFAQFVLRYGSSV